MTDGGDFSLLHRIRSKYNTRLRELGALLPDPERNYTAIRRAKQLVLDQITGYVRCGGDEGTLNLPSWYVAAGGRRGRVQPPNVAMEPVAKKVTKEQFLSDFLMGDDPALPPTEPNSPLESLGPAGAFERVMRSAKISSIIDSFLDGY